VSVVLEPVRFPEVPEGPVDIDEVLRRFPSLRQSLLADFDDCELSAFFRMKYENGWSTHPQAGGTLFHRFAAECLRTMRAQDHESIPLAVAMPILEEVCYQRGVPPEDIVRVPTRDLPLLEMAARKFAKDNSFTVRNIIDVERRLSAVLTYEGPDGRPVTRTLTGQIDALIARPPDEAIVLDWKHTWALPPDRPEDADDPGVSYHGYFQQRFYAWLVMMVYPTVMAVTLREFYVRRTKARSARVTRADLPTIEQELRYLVANIDRALMSGEPKKLTLAALDAHGSWKPSPGKHCHWCTKASRCPLDDDYKDGAVRTPGDASRLAGVRTQAKAIVAHCDRILKPYVDLHGPIEIKRAKGRLVLGYRTIKGGKLRWEEYTPEGADRPPTKDAYSPNLEEAMRSATERARAERDARRSARA
jgi:hypothetical protein